MRYPDPRPDVPGPFWITRYQRRQYRRWYARYYGPKHGCLLWLSVILMCGWIVNFFRGVFHPLPVNWIYVILLGLFIRWCARPRHRQGRPPADPPSL